MLAYCTRKGTAVPADLLASLLTIKHEVQESNGGIKPDSDARLWEILAALTKLAAPATFKSLDVNTRTWKLLYFIFFLVVLVTLLWLQFCLSVGSSLSTDVSALQKQADDLQATSNAKAVAVAAIAGSTGAVPSPTPAPGATETELARTYEQLNAKTGLVDLWVGRADKWVPFLTEPKKELRESAAKETVPSNKPLTTEDFRRIRQASQEQQAKALLYEDGLRLYLLPLLYGLLGALMFVLRRIGKEGELYIGEGDWVRICFGAAAGVAMGLFFSPAGSQSQTLGNLQATALSLSPFALAFAGGYSTDILFAALDRLITAFAGKSDTETRLDASTQPPATIAALPSINASVQNGTGTGIKPPDSHTIDISSVRVSDPPHA